MKQFHILIVEDYLRTVELLEEQLESASAELAPDSEMKFYNARTQKEADDLLQRPPFGGYSLVLLDLRYPDSDPDGLAQDNGIRWLPTLRASQPAAAIAVVTDFAFKSNLEWAVIALRDGRADEFIPKGIPWEETLARIKSALQRAIDRQVIEDATRPDYSNVRRTVAEDQAMELARAQQNINAHLDQIVSTAPALRGVAEAITGILQDLARRLALLGSNLTVDTAVETGQIDCGALAAECGAYYDIQMRAFSGRTKWGAQDNCVVETYGTDLKVALEKCLGSDSKSFPEEVIASPIEQNRSLWADTSFPHLGMGLYVAHRMMHSIGGHICVENVEGPQGRHGRATLMVKDWKMV